MKRHILQRKSKANFRVDRHPLNEGSFVKSILEDRSLFLSSERVVNNANKEKVEITFYSALFVKLPPEIISQKDLSFSSSPNSIFAYVFINMLF